jgi:hypothetical protein
MDLSLTLGVSAFAKGEKPQPFATTDKPSAASALASAQHGPASANVASPQEPNAAFTDGAGNPIDAARLAGAFRVLVDQLMGGDQTTADDIAPPPRHPRSEADDLAATLDGASDGEEPESDEVSQRTPAELWLVELEIVNRATGVHADRGSSAAPVGTGDAKRASDAPVDQDVQPPLDAIGLSWLADATRTAVRIDPSNRPAYAHALSAHTAAVQVPASEEAPSNAFGTTSMPSGQSHSETPGTDGAGVRSAGPTVAHPTTDTIGEARPQQRQPASLAAGSAAQIVPTPAAPPPVTFIAIRSDGEGAQPSPFISLQPGTHQESSTSGREASSGSGFTAQRAGVTTPEGAAPLADLGTLNRNTSFDRRPAEADRGRPAGQPASRGVSALQAFMSRDGGSVPKTTEPVSNESLSHIATKPPTSAAAIEVGGSMAAALATSPTSWDEVSERGRQPESPLLIARPISADAMTPALVQVAFGAHEPLSVRTGPLSSPAVRVGWTADTRPSLPEETANQIVQAIRLQITRHGGEATIRLEPKHFGELSITVRVDQGQVSARLQAESPVVREYLQTHQNLLRDSLADQQLTLGKFDVAEPPAEARGGERRSAEERAFGGDRQPQRRRQPSPETPFEPFEVIA